MSLRIRLVAVAVLALAVLCIAGVALRDLAHDGERGRLEGVVTANRAILAALETTLHDRPGNPPSSLAWRADLRRRARVVIGATSDARGGYCFDDGTILEQEAGPLRDGPPRPHGRLPPPPGMDGTWDGPPDGGAEAPGEPAPHDDGDSALSPGATPHHMPPAVRAELQARCSADSPAEPIEARIDGGPGRIMVAVGAPLGGVRAFVLRFVPEYPHALEDRRSGRLLTLVALTLVLVAVTLDALLAIRRGASGLSRALSTIETDLRAEVPAVPGKEFADVAERIRRVATHLADARERERALERKIAHDNRLASLGRVVAGVAHEVRNPLTGMKLLLDGLARRALDARSAEDVEVCLSELARLEHLVTSLLGVARSGETGRFVHDIAGLVDERIAALREVARPRGVELERRGEARIFAVRDVLVRVVDNLLRNAIEASPAGGKVRVVVSAMAREGAAGRGGDVDRGDVERVEIDVQDDGPGVPEAAREELFEPFRTTKAGGTGLGLWLSHTALTAQGATLEYRRDGGVTHFVVGLPRVPA